MMRERICYALDLLDDPALIAKMRRPSPGRRLAVRDDGLPTPSVRNTKSAHWQPAGDDRHRRRVLPACLRCLQERGRVSADAEAPEASRLCGGRGKMGGDAAHGLPGRTMTASLRRLAGPGFGCRGSVLARPRSPVPVARSRMQLPARPSTRHSTKGSAMSTPHRYSGLGLNQRRLGDPVPRREAKCQPRWCGFSSPRRAPTWR